MGFAYCNFSICLTSNRQSKGSELTKSGYLLNEKLNNNFPFMKLTYEEFCTLEKFFKKKFIKTITSINLNNNQNSKTIKDYIDIYYNYFNNLDSLKSFYWIFAGRWFENEGFNHYPNGLGINKNDFNFNNSKKNEKMDFIDFKKLIKNDLKEDFLKLRFIIKSFLNFFFKNYQNIEFSKQYLKKLDIDIIINFQANIVFELQNYLIEPIFEIIKFIYGGVFEKYEDQTTKLIFHIYNRIHKLIFEENQEIYEFLLLFIEETTKPNKKTLKKKLSLQKYQNLESYEIDKLFSFSENSLNSTKEDNEIYMNAIQIFDLIKTKKTPLNKIKIIAEIQNQIWETIVNNHQNYNTDFSNEKIQNLKEKYDPETMLNLYSYIIYRGQNYKIHREIKFIELFIDEKLLENHDLLYYFEMFKSATEYITFQIK